VINTTPTIVLVGIFIIFILVNIPSKVYLLYL